MITNGQLTDKGEALSYDRLNTCTLQRSHCVFTRRATPKPLLSNAIASQNLTVVDGRKVGLHNIGTLLCFFTELWAKVFEAMTTQIGVVYSRHELCGDYGVPGGCISV